jgi:hypothetical protein
MDIEKLKALALAASPGPWSTDDPHIVYCEDDNDIIYLANTAELDTDYKTAICNASYIAAACPAAVLELIAEVERLRADANRYRWLRDKANSQLGRAPMVFNCNPEDALCWTDSLHGARLDAVMDVFVDAAIEKEKA